MRPPSSMQETAANRRPLSAPVPPAMGVDAAIVPIIVVSTTVEWKPGICNRLVVALWTPMAAASKPMMGKAATPSRDPSSSCTTIAMTTSSSSTEAMVLDLLMPLMDGRIATQKIRQERLFARGDANRQIAHELNIGEQTVKTHVVNIPGKFQRQSRSQAALFAVERGLVSLPEAATA